MSVIRSVAVIGAGASGAAAAAALKAEGTFEVIKVFERRESAGGTWIHDPKPSALRLCPGGLPPDVDPPLDVPESLPTTAPPNRQQRYTATPIYDELTTNVPDIAMAYSDLPFPYGPFVPHWIPKQYIESYFSWHQTDSALVLNTTVEDVLHVGNGRWRLTLRKYDSSSDLDNWWREDFDALIIANGHYSVPFVPAVKGLSSFMARFKDRIEHSKNYRTPHTYANQRVLVIGNSASGHDILTQFLQSGVTKSPIYVSRRSRSRWDGDRPPPGVVWKPVISEYRLDGTIVFADGSTLNGLDKILYCTGYKPSYPFWDAAANGRPLYDYKDDWLINNYQHTFVSDFPTLGFIGFPRVLTFRSMEYQAIALARLWSGRSAKPLPPITEQKEWLRQRAETTKRDRRKFHQIEWDCGETMEWFEYLFQLSGLPMLEGYGKCPPVLGPQTRWAIEHLKKYPEKTGSDLNHIDDEDEIDESWTFVHSRDSLHFI